MMNDSMHRVRRALHASGVGVARRSRVAGVVVAATLALCATSAVAQDDRGALRPPQPSKEPDAPTFMTLASLLLLAAGLVGVAVLPSKRGHQD